MASYFMDNSMFYGVWMGLVVVAMIGIYFVVKGDKDSRRH